MAMGDLKPAAGPGPVARLALACTAWTERWLPDPFIFALLATLLVAVASVTFGDASPAQVVDAWGGKFWDLVPFTMQMSLIIITGYVLATSPPVGRMITAIAAWPTTPRSAVALVTLFALATSLVNWGFSLIFSAVLVRAVARRGLDVDYRALAASTVLGLGSVWAQGLSGSAALQMASAGALPPAIRDIVAGGGLVPGGIISFQHTIFLWQSLLSVVIESAVITAVMWLATPPAGCGRTAQQLGIDLSAEDDAGPATPRDATPGQWFENSRLLTWLTVLLAGAYLVRYFMRAAEPLAAINLNTVNLVFLMIGFLLHGTPARLMRSVQAATPAAWGVILQFPFYAGIAGIITSTHLGDRLAQVFASLSSTTTFPAVVAVYSTVLGVFVPSGGSKWVIEAPYVMAAAHQLKVHLGWVVASYDLGEALAGLVQPFWMLPVLGLLQLRARDIMGYTFVGFLVLLPLVIVLVTVLGMTLSYPL